MRRLTVAAICLALAGAACSRGKESGPTAYQRDIDRLCHAQTHSGADELDPGQRPVAIAQWLSENLETSEVREVLVEFQAGTPEQKRAILEREAAEVGLPDCPLADAWADVEEAPAGEGERDEE